MILMTHFFTSLVVPSCLAILVEVFLLLTDACSLLLTALLLASFCFIKHSAAAALNSRSKYTEGVACICNLYDMMLQLL